MEDNLKDNPPKKQPKQKWKTNQSTKINLIGCDTIENSPSYVLEPLQTDKDSGKIELMGGPGNFYISNLYKYFPTLKNNPSWKALS